MRSSVHKANVSATLAGNIVRDMAGALGFILFLGVCLSPLLLLP